MPKVVGYHRPSSVAEALQLLAQPGTAVLAGGTVLNADRLGEPVVAVDVQRLGLSGVGPAGPGRIRVGATTTLQQFADDALVPDGLRALARHELPSTLRTLATIGGTVAAGGWCSALLAGLLVHDAQVELAGAGEPRQQLADVLAGRDALHGRLVIAVELATDGAFASAMTGRTPGDEPIVAACARRGDDGAVRVALAGVAGVPVLVVDASAIDPPGDFRGSATYRRHVAGVLADRVRAEVAA